MLEPDERARRTSSLAVDLERALSYYGVDCRGLGFLAAASALVDEGWCNTESLRPRPKPPRVGPEHTALAKRILAEYGVRADDFVPPEGGVLPPRMRRLRTYVIRRMVAESGLTQRDVADVLGFTDTMVSKAVRYA